MPAAADDAIESSPGFVQSVINKIIGNIQYSVSNLVVKYVDGNVVASASAKTLTWCVRARGPSHTYCWVGTPHRQAADASWEGAFVDLTGPTKFLRQILHIHDLTLCIDPCDRCGGVCAFAVGVRCAYG